VLERYLRLLAREVGVSYQLALSNLRNYMRTQDRNVLKREIRALRNPLLFRYLWAAGLDAELQQVAMEAWRRLT